MSRNAFGPWGAELPPEEFARALAVAGRLYAGEVVPWVLPEQPARWALSDVPEVPAEALAREWPAVANQMGVGALRLGITDTPAGVSPAWVAQTLAAARIGLGSVFLVNERPHHVTWSWPLQVAVLGPGAEALAEQVSRARWVEQFVEVVTPEAAGAFDLLLVTRGLREGLPFILEAPARASVVAFLDVLAEPWERVHALLDAVFADTDAGGVVFVDAREPVYWLDSTLYELSHDQPLDVALFRANVGETPPLLAADPRMLNETRLAQVAMRFRERLSTARTELRSRADAANGGAAELQASAEAVEDLERAVGNVRDYLEESGGATDLMHLDLKARDLVPPPAPRFVQAQVYEASKGERIPLFAFRTNALHELRVRIGPPDEEWSAATEVFDEHSLPPGREHRLRLVLPEPHLLDAPQEAEITLPERGPSGHASFWLRTRPNPSPVQARIVVLHEGRVLQTVTLRADVRRHPEKALPEDLGISVEALVHPFMALTGRTPFDAAFVVNEDRTGTDRVTTITPTHVDIREPEDLRSAFKEIAAKLEELVTAEDVGDIPLRDDRMRDLLVFLAVQGRSIYERLVDVQPGRAIAALQRIQILSLEPEKLFPLEFVYDSVSPDEDAELCPTAEHELANGALDTCPARTDARYVCPLGFWGLRKVIERHAHDPESTDVPEADFRVSDWPDALRKKRLRPFTGALVGASSRVDTKRPETTAELVQRLSGLVGAAPTRALTWDEWRTGVESSAPPLLVMLPHTLPHPTLKVPSLEIGEKQVVRFDKIDTTYVGSEWPIVFLFGCETSEAPIEFQKIPTRFRQQHAGVVVATLTRVLGRNAGPVAGELVAAFAEESKSARITFGEVLRKVRCSLLARGFPTVLTVVAFGDADWVFQPRDA